MKRSAAAFLIIALIEACSAIAPRYSELVGASSREELKSRFGEPDFVRRGRNFTDVRSIGEPSVNAQYPDIEIWEYISTRDGEPGRAYFRFGVNNQTGEEVLGDRNWIGDPDN